MMKPSAITSLTNKGFVVGGELYFHAPKVRRQAGKCQYLRQVRTMERRPVSPWPLLAAAVCYGPVPQLLKTMPKVCLFERSVTCLLQYGSKFTELVIHFTQVAPTGCGRVLHYFRCKGSSTCRGRDRSQLPVEPFGRRAFLGFWSVAG